MTSSESGESIRIGSPFAVDPVAADPISGDLTASPTVIEPVMDVGSLRYTAMGATAASAMVVGFAAAAWGWFPAGGAAIAALGCGLSIFGMFSVYRFTAMGLLAVHLFLFVANYGQALK
ncbi:hypothetical protein [Rubripirellula reticaptiva]|uniref:Uncharacterized protein n=1 Tax=Rubripirellula reticaptiva TaxID=2528013 RepID=A0A5C6ENF9_9BACT|nr:hypothetical protein [Rubripirellula reticaptiva]TWU49126.1 hypothetical protein Poly59_37400 [Rubripirellula reticaptiva]